MHIAFGEWVHGNVDFILDSHSLSEGPEEEGVDKYSRKTSNLCPSEHKQF